MSTFWKIEESVGGGKYIALEGIFETQEAAEAAIRCCASNQWMRAAPYETGGWTGGPRRVHGWEPSCPKK